MDIAVFRPDSAKRVGVFPASSSALDDVKRVLLLKDNVTGLLRGCLAHEYLMESIKFEWFDGRLHVIFSLDTSWGKGPLERMLDSVAQFGDQVTALPVPVCVRVQLRWR